VLELEYTLIPHGMHVIGAPPEAEERVEMLMALGEASHGKRPQQAGIEALVAGMPPEDVMSRGLGGDGASLAMMRDLAETDRLLAIDHELPSLMHALDGRYVRPVAGGDLLRTPSVLPSGRNVHGFDPYRIPSAFAMQDGERQTGKLLARYADDGHKLPESLVHL
jgi:magnesium chelatase subunit H